MAPCARLGDILRSKDTSLVKQAILQMASESVREGKIRAGSILAEAEPFESVEDLVEQACDEKKWRKRVNSMCPQPHRVKQRKSKRTQSYNVQIRFTNNKD